VVAEESRKTREDIVQIVPTIYVLSYLNSAAARLVQ
jgi:hypothetical protein